MLATALLLFLQAAPVDPFRALLDRISRLAASEPVEYGIDTRLKLAEALASKFPEKAKRQLRDAQAALPGVPGNAGNMWRGRLAAALAALDFDEAERLAKSIAPDREHDYAAQAYDELYAHLGKRDRAGFIHDAIAAGAFRLKCAAQLLGELKAKAPSEALALFEEILNAFPGDPDRRDIEYLQERIQEMEMFDSEVVKAAVKKTIVTAEPHAKEKKNDETEAMPDISKLRLSEAIGLLSKLKDFSVRAGALIDLSRREDLSRQEQARFASEALSAVAKMKISEDRLVGLSMLSRDFVKRREYSSAALAAQMLSETYTKACECKAAICKVDDETFDCIDLMNSFAEYLQELKISHESMGLQNISLEARLLILSLASHKSPAEPLP